MYSIMLNKGYLHVNALIEATLHYCRHVQNLILPLTICFQLNPH